MAGDVLRRAGIGVDLRQGRRVAFGIFARRDVSGDLSAHRAQMGTLRQNHAKDHLSQIAHVRMGDQPIKFLTGVMNGLAEEGTKGDHRDSG